MKKNERKRQERNHPQVQWADTSKDFGNRLDFLTPEQAHLASGGLSILPAHGSQASKEEG